VIRDLLVSLGYDLKQPLSLLEFGAGFGDLTRHWAQALPRARITVCDPRQEAVDFIAAHFDVEAALSPSIPEQMAAGGDFDIVVAPSLSPQAGGNWLKALYGQVKKGGHLIFAGQGRSSATPVDGAEIPASGIWHRPETGRDAEGSGSTFLDRDEIAVQVRSELGEEISVYGPGLWSGDRDIYVVRRSLS
jgi:hypothetical protein